MPRAIAYSGLRFTIDYAIRSSGKSPGLSFYEDLDQSDQAKLNALFARLGDSGRIANTEKFKKLQDNLFEFKSNQIRMPCVFVPNVRVVRISHGFIKKRGKTPAEEIRRAKQIFEEDGLQV